MTDDTNLRTDDLFSIELLRMLSNPSLIHYTKQYITEVLMNMDMNYVSIGMKAPAFTAATTMGVLSMSDYKGHWLVFFSHPGDFTPVCTTEFLAFTKAVYDFCAINTMLLGLSIDSIPSHLAWVNCIKKLTGAEIPFPIVADRDGSIAAKYGMIAPDVSTQETVRNVYIIDPDQTIRAILSYPLTVGRCIPEILRLVTALQTSDAYGIVTPANWVPGDDVLVPPPKTYMDQQDRIEDPESLGLSCKDWFWCYKDNM